MKKRKLSLSKIVTLIATVGLFSSIAVGCSNKTNTAGVKPVTEVKVGTTSDVPTVWKAVEKKLAGDNIKIKIVNFANGANPNQALADGDIDLNAFQHYAYLNKNKADLKLDITAIGDTIVYPLDLFSKTVKNVADFKNGAKIALPNDETNEGRALNVLQSAGIIKLKDGAGLNPILKDITSNPKNIKFVELVGGQIPRSLGDVDAAIINCGYAIDSGLDLDKDVLFKDKIDITDPNKKPYINVIVARTKDKDKEVYKKIVDAYHSDEVAKAITQQFKGAAIPAWDKKYSDALNVTK
ncbi:MetQ/NlpA family ABC transporter substrate-binding protein [Clostridium algoriphilum]|uniref:MetQ/NlpA family ABC transporter substrate-binding protein n=1 Tax=Clostridium algoriphilum TaxID=198347 RepID=UPI001CF31BBC|nr:MetQ/NlpA family ABC transporter substrate-binding protein [Clostridium algoriphilum]MCB2294825.1 MetQ/NlpA family ABC transporter substrate-binding protein [Clostridium algoriphilum]